MCSDDMQVIKSERKEMGHCFAVGRKDQKCLKCHSDVENKPFQLNNKTTFRT